MCLDETVINCSHHPLLLSWHPEKEGWWSRGWSLLGRRDKIIIIFILIRVAEVAREHGWHPPKSLDSDGNFKPKHTLFCRKLRFVAICDYVQKIVNRRLTKIFMAIFAPDGRLPSSATLWDTN